MTTVCTRWSHSSSSTDVSPSMPGAVPQIVSADWRTQLGFCTDPRDAYQSLSLSKEFIPKASFVMPLSSVFALLGLCIYCLYAFI